VIRVDGGVIAAAEELLAARHYPSVIAMVTDAIAHEPTCVPLLLLRARAHLALRRDLDAQADLRDVIRVDRSCALAFRLLGILAARRDEHVSAATFFREALRLDPHDQEAEDWLLIVDSIRPAAVATQHPAPATAAGRSTSSSPRPRGDSQPRFAKGTRSPDVPDNRQTQPLGRGSDRSLPSKHAPAPPRPGANERRPTTLPGRPPAPPPARPAPKLPSRPLTRGPLPELPGFGDYLVATGILTRERLRAAQAYQRSMKVQLTTAIVTLGLATPQRIEWACVAHQSHLGRERQ